MCHISLCSFTLINAKSFAAYMYSPALRVRWHTSRSSAIACIGTPKLAPSDKNFIALILSSAAIRSPFPAARGCRTFLLVKAALLPWPTAHLAMPSKQQVRFPFSVVPALGADFGVSAPGFYAAIPFDPPCLVHLIHLHKVPPARSAFGRGNSCLAPAGKLPVVKDLFLCNRHVDLYR